MHDEYKNIEQRFLKYVNKNGPTISKELGACWLWIGWKDSHGYGRLSVPKGFNGKTSYDFCHRLIYKLKIGPIPKKFVVMHKCDTPACVNPFHLKTGTVTENNQDRARKLRNRNQNGENNNQSKLDKTKVLVIKYLYKHTGLSQISLGKIFKVSSGAIQRILDGDNWKHLIGEELNESDDCLQKLSK